MSEDTVAILMPTYNAEAFLARALDSALAQTRPAEQVLVVNDGSTDGSGAIARDYAQRYPGRGIEVIDRENGGEPAARNTGLAAARTRWIANLDADDWWEPRKLEMQVAAARQAGPQCVLVHTAGRKVFPDGTFHEQLSEATARRVGWVTRTLLEPASIGHPSCMMRVDALRQVGGYDAQFRQACDIDMYFRMSVIGTFAYVPVCLVNYRVHPGQLSARQFEQIVIHHKAIRKFFRQHPDKLEEIGRETVDAAIAEHTRIKLESLYWRRRLEEFRQLLDYAQREGIASPGIEQWRQRARWPDWLIRIKDWLDRRRGEKAAG